MSLALRQKNPAHADEPASVGESVGESVAASVAHRALHSGLCPALRPAFQAPVAITNTEFNFAASDYDRVRRLIYEHAGIALSDSKQAMVYSRLTRLLRDTGHASFNSYLQWLESSKSSAVDNRWQAFVNALTTNLTAFFREDHHFVELAADLQKYDRKPLRIWCNAASTGEEPYSIAMTVSEALGNSAVVSLLATDIDTNVLATAQRGVYGIDARGVSPQRRQRHFLKGKGDNATLMRVKPELARGIEFRAHNLIQPQWSLGEAFDIVFCRNVMIYFDNATQHEVLERIHKTMKPDGLLYVGHSESFNDAKHLFRLRGKTIYERL
jgi:chemotaxis protein methyltransferase CheR